MSCRNTPTGSLATTFVQRYFGLKDAQSTSLYHELTRVFKESDGEISAPTDEEYHSHISNIAFQIRDNLEKWPEGSRIRNDAIERVLNASTSRLVSNANKYALVSIEERARYAVESKDAFIERYHNEGNMPKDYIIKSFDHYYKTFSDASREQRSAFLGTISADFTFPSYFPQDDATKYATYKIRKYILCGICNKGQYLGVNQGIHTACILGIALPDSQTNIQEIISQGIVNTLINNNISIDTDTLIDINPSFENAVMPEVYVLEETFPITEEIASVSRTVPRRPSVRNSFSKLWDMEEFQDEYNEAISYLKNSNMLPADLEKEQIPGAITGGLGARVTGKSFGIELELDFPDDTYPYSKRAAFAQKLYLEGINLMPNISGWHYLGNGRAGGDFQESQKWICEFDRTVDDVEGTRGIEIKSQILYDEPETWVTLRRICEIATEFGAKPTQKTGLHINIDGHQISNEDPKPHVAMLRLASAYDDTMIRLAHNPLSGAEHRGRYFCRPVNVPPRGFTNIRSAKRMANHYQAFNLNHLPQEGESHRTSSRVEVRIWDSTLDPVRIQAATTISLAIVDAGIKKVKLNRPSEHAGTHRLKYDENKLSKEEWHESSESFRSLVSLLDASGANSNWHKSTFTKMFASSHWQKEN